MVFFEGGALLSSGGFYLTVEVVVSAYSGSAFFGDLLTGAFLGVVFFAGAFLGAALGAAALVTLGTATLATFFVIFFETALTATFLGAAGVATLRAISRIKISDQSSKNIEMFFQLAC